MAAPVGRSVLIYGAAFAAVGLTPFLLLPLLTRQLSPQQFGEVTSFLVLTALLANVAGLSAHGFVSVRYFKTEQAQFPALVCTSLWTMAGLHVLALLVMAALYPWVAGSLALPWAWALLSVPAALLLNFNLLFLALFQSSSQPVRYLRVRLIQAACELVLCLVLLWSVAPDAGARIHSYTIALASAAAAGWWMCRRMQLTGSPPQRRHLQGMLAFGVPMLPHIVAGTALSYVDRLVVSTLLGPESLGIYMVALQIGMAMVALIEPLNKALAPWLFEQLAKNDTALRRLIVRRTYQLYAALIVLGLIVTTVATLYFSELIGKQFAAARMLVPWMVAGFVLQGMYYSVVNYLFYAERTGRLSTVTASVALVGCSLSYLLTSTWGLQGAAWSFALNNMLLFLCVWAVAARAVPMPWQLWLR